MHKSSRGLPCLFCSPVPGCMSCLYCSAVLCCLVCSALCGWVELHAGRSSVYLPLSLSLLFLLLHEELQYTCVFHPTISQRRAPSLPGYLISLIPLSFSTSHTQQCEHHFALFHLHLLLFIHSSFSSSCNLKPSLIKHRHGDKGEMMCLCRDIWQVLEKKTCMPNALFAP